MEKENFSIWNYILKHKYAYLMGIVFLFICDYFSLYIPEYTGDIIDGLYAGNTLDYVLSVAKKILIVAVILAFGRFFWRYFIFGSAQKISYELRNDMFKHLESLSARYFNAHKTGDLMAHFTNDFDALKECVGYAVMATFDAIIMAVMTIFKMIYNVNLKLTCLTFIPMIFIALGCYVFGVKMEDAQVKRQDSFSSLSDKVQESFTGIRVLKAFTQEEEDIKSFDESNKENRTANENVVKLRATFFPLLDFLIGISLLINLLAGGKMVLEGEISPGQFVEFNSYINMLVWPMIAAGDCLNTFSLGIAASKRIGDIFKEEPDIVDSENAVDIPIEGEISFDHLSFTYPDGYEPVLNDVSLTIKKGETLGILGRTGSGKSSLSDLLLRVYDVEEGMIKIDGRNIDEYSLSTLHKDVAYVPQDNFLFSDTLEENIAFGIDERIANDKNVRDRIMKATRASCIHDNIMDFPDKYQTIVGERGVTLSGGQKQRSSIARAILKDSAILILDDALSAVDTDTEEQILNNIKELRKDKTTIIIAHRISTLEDSDHIMVLNNGSISEYGTHDELIKEDGFYANIYKKQQLEAELGKM